VRNAVTCHTFPFSMYKREIVRTTMAIVGSAAIFSTPELNLNGLLLPFLMRSTTLDDTRMVAQQDSLGRIELNAPFPRYAVLASKNSNKNL